ncbi:hypothetical protein B0T18DRAFT_407342, partial [Schizothecium vesticola]
MGRWLWVIASGPPVFARTACGRGNPVCSASFPICPEFGYTMARHFRSRPRMYGNLPQARSLPHGHGVPRLFLQPSLRWPGRFASDLGGPETSWPSVICYLDSFLDSSTEFRN